MNCYLTKEQRTELIAQYIDCFLETGGSEEDAITTENMLLKMSNSQLISEIKESGWDIN